jgi:hypothetical protein
MGGAATSANEIVAPQTPDPHASVSVHALPSSQAVPLGAFGFEQVPVAGSHVPLTWQTSYAEQTTGLPPRHDPFRHVSDRVQALPSSHSVPSGTGAVVHEPSWHVSGCVQGFPSLHAVPFGAIGFEQLPVAASHVPEAWHWSSGRHSTGAPSQAPPWHASFVVHRSPSLQDEPSGRGTALHAPVAGSHSPA